MSMEKRFREIEMNGGAFRGKSEILKYLSGGRLTASQSIKAKCYECMGYYADGKQDCKIKTCPLHAFMPYKEGGAQKSRAGKVLTEEHKAKMRSSKKSRTKAV